MFLNKIKPNSLFACLALGMAILFTSGLATAFAQTDDSTASKIEKSTLFAKVMPPNPANSKVVNLPSASRKGKTASTDWNGVYVGGYAGVSVNRSTGDTSTLSPAAAYFAVSSIPAIAAVGHQSLGSTRFTGGGTFGYNHQSGNWLVGVETDFGVTPGTRRVTAAGTYPCCAPTTFTINQSMKTSWLWTARPRVGYVHDNVLFYLTGGLSVARVTLADTFTDTFASATESGGFSKTAVGWNGGGGIEYKMAGNWSIKGEYLYEDLGRSSSTSTNLMIIGIGPVALPTQTFTHSVFLRSHDLRFGFNYHF